MVIERVFVDSFFPIPPLNSDTISENPLFDIKPCHFFNIFDNSVSFYCLFLKKDYNEARRTCKRFNFASKDTWGLSKRLALVA